MDSLITLTKKLIKFKSTASRPTELERLVDFVEDYFKGGIFFIKRFKDAGKPSIVITFENKKNPRIFLVGHLDVVEADEQDFIPRIRGNKLFARGAGDMKGNAACLIKIMKEFFQEGLKPDIGLMLTSDEEIGGVNGVNFLLNKRGYNCKLAIIPDGGKLDEITIKEKGVLRLIVEAKGKSVHGSRPWKGDNAIEKIMKAYFEIKRLFSKVGFKDNWKETLNLGKISGGEEVNKVPGFAKMELDIRFTEKTNWKEIYQKILGITSKIKGVKIKIIGVKEVLFTSPDNFYLKKYKEVCQRLLGRKVKFSREHGASDASHFAKKRIPVILHEPECRNVHAKNEWLDIKSQKIYYQILKKFLQEFFIG